MPALQFSWFIYSIRLIKKKKKNIIFFQICKFVCKSVARTSFHSPQWWPQRSGHSEAFNLLLVHRISTVWHPGHRLSWIPAALGILNLKTAFLPLSTASQPLTTMWQPGWKCMSEKKDRISILFFPPTEHIFALRLLNVILILCPFKCSIVKL